MKRFTAGPFVFFHNEALAAIKNSPVIYARQADIANGPQHVNNGSRAQETEDQLNKLLEQEHGERLDTRVASTASGTNLD